MLKLQNGGEHDRTIGVGGEGVGATAKRDFAKIEIIFKMSQAMRHCKYNGASSENSFEKTKGKCHLIPGPDRCASLLCCASSIHFGLGSNCCHC